MTKTPILDGCCPSICPINGMPCALQEGHKGSHLSREMPLPNSENPTVGFFIWGHPQLEDFPDPALAALEGEQGEQAE